MNRYLLAFASPDIAAGYDRAALSAADSARLGEKPALEQRLQWRTSRALLATWRTSHPDWQTCLSHKDHHAALALGKDKPGVDLEKLRKRDVQALAAHSFSAEECAWLAAQRDPQLGFYQLWTLKEALIKAENLRFPNDLHHCGLRGKTLYSPGRCAYRWLTVRLDGQWLLSGIWPDRGAQPVALHIYAPQPVAVERIAGNLAAVQAEWHFLSLSREK